MTHRPITTPGLGAAELGLCLDFVNSEGMHRNHPPDRLGSIELFLDWQAPYGLCGAAEVEMLRQTAATPRGEALFLQRARALREALYGIFAAVARQRDPRREDRAILDRSLAAALSRLRLAWEEGAFRWVVAEPVRRGEEILAPIVLSAADLLRSDLLARVKECSADGCAWMFFDLSRNRSRRWCDMANCGNRAKARRFYQRHHRKRRSAG